MVTKVSLFVTILSGNFLAERHIDAFVMHLNIETWRMKLSAPTVLVAGLDFANTLSLHCNALASEFGSCTLFLQYAAVFKRKKAYRVLLFPAHVGGVSDGHWVVFRVDFVKCEYSYGE